MGLNLSGLTNLEVLKVEYCTISSVDLSIFPKLTTLVCNNTQITTLDFRANPFFNELACRNNPNLTSIYMKNGAIQNFQGLNYGDNWNNCPNLNYICADASEIPALQSFLAPNYNLANININATCALGTEDFEKENVVVFPNPATNAVFLDNSKAQFDSVVVYNNLGQEILTQKLNSTNQENIDINALASGIYLLKFNHNEKTILKTIIKK